MNDDIKKILNKTNKAESLLALARDKKFFLSECKKSFIMYQNVFQSLIALGDPVGCENTWIQLITDFLLFAKKKIKKLYSIRLNILMKF